MNDDYDSEWSLFTRTNQARSVVFKPISENQIQTVLGYVRVAVIVSCIACVSY